MRVCPECGKENIAHLPRYPYICSHEYEDKLIGLKQTIKQLNKRINELQEAKNKPYKEKVNQRNRQIRDLLHKLKEKK